MNNSLNTPILLICFNRPDTTKMVFECIKSVKPKRLYIAADGPRDNIAKDILNCAIVRQIKDQVDWDCTVLTLYQNKNLGCKLGVVSAINWFFESEEQGIILEDDIIPDSSFFPFADQLLNQYKNSSEIKAVLGFNYYGQQVESNSYSFYNGFYPWGWATWRRAWKQYSESNFDISLLNSIKQKKPNNRHLIDSIELNLDLIQRGLLDTWDYQFMYMLAITDGLSIVPLANLTKNIGANGAHSVNNTLNFKYGYLNPFKLEHPVNIKIDDAMSKMLLSEYYKNRHIISLKKFLLKVSLYNILKKIRKKYFVL